MNRSGQGASLASGDLRGTVNVRHRGWFRRLISFSGPAYLVSVGYMDPGNWATDIEGGARFGYTLVWVLLMSNLMAILLQTLSARLGIVTGHDLAQGCRREYPKPLAMLLWVLAEIAIAACDLAEVLGTVIGLNLLFGLPLLWGCGVTLFDTFLLLAIQRLGVRKMEAFILMLVGTIGGCFLIEMFLAKPDWGGVIHGVVPHLDPSSLYVAIGIIGATVMPHNLYLHSSLVQSRRIADTDAGKKEACRFNLIDSAVALNGAFFVNAAILILAASTFFTRGMEVTEIQQAHGLLAPLLGSNIAPVVFAIALLAAGQSSTLTGTLAGQIIMEGFLEIRLRPWLRRLITRSIAVVPAAIAIALMGDTGAYDLLILSQVILSLQLPFAIIPLIHFTSDPSKMGSFTNKLWVIILAWVVAAIIVGLNLKLVAEKLEGGLTGQPLWLQAIGIAGVSVILGALVWVTFRAFGRRGKRWTTPAAEGAAAAAAMPIADLVTTVGVKHIGVALERSETDAVVLSYAMTTARHYGARLTLMHVVDTPGTMVYGADSDSLHRTEDEAYLDRLATRVKAEGLSVDIAVRSGEPAEQIIAMTATAGFDMLVLGSHGHRGISDVIHGQTVTAVRHAVGIPVLVVPMRAETDEAS